MKNHSDEKFPYRVFNMKMMNNKFVESSSANMLKLQRSFFYKLRNNSKGSNM